MHWGSPCIGSLQFQRISLTMHSGGSSPQSGAQSCTLDPKISELWSEAGEDHRGILGAAELEKALAESAGEGSKCEQSLL